MIEARWLLSDLTEEGCGFRVDAQGYGPGDMVWQTSANRAFAITVSRNGVTLEQQIARADAHGRLQFTLKSPAIEPITLRFACND